MNKQQIIHPLQREVSGIATQRLLPSVNHLQVGPWIYMQHIGPVYLLPGNGLNVRPHPHINIATVSYLFAGQIHHRDSIGSDQLIQPGDLNIMVAGKGIVHSERELSQNTLHQRLLHGLQFWLALPTSEEECEPDFIHYPCADLPATNVDGAAVRVLIGTAYGLTSPVKTFCETLYVEANLESKQVLMLDTSAEQNALYVADGEVILDDQVVGANTLVVLNKNYPKITSLTDSQIALIGGKNLGKRYLWWGFASSRKERIEQAKLDWSKGKFATIPGDEHEHIPMPITSPENY